MKNFILGALSALLLYFAYNNISLSTKQRMVFGVTNYQLLAGRSIVTVLDPKTKEEYNIDLWTNGRLYHDVGEKRVPYIKWKENQLVAWGVEVHVR